MPCIAQSTYRPPWFLRNGHLQTICAQQFRIVKGVTYSRERIGTPDDDFLDLDWSAHDNYRCAILLHGLEGNSQRLYMRGMTRALNRKGWDTVAVNLRGCSGETNRRLRFYHHGVTDDLHTVIEHVTKKPYDKITVVGFSLGGNVTLKYLGEGIFPISDKLCCAVAISTPCDLYSCALKMERGSNALYMRRFLRMLHVKIIRKKAMYPVECDDTGYEKIRTFKQYDDRYTAPIHGFASAEDYWMKCASGQFLHAIQIPALLINAADDPFLMPACFPREAARASKSLFLEIPRYGGHVGFIVYGNSGQYWHETRTVEFIDERG